MSASRKLALSGLAGTVLAVVLIVLASMTGGTTVLRTSTVSTTTASGNSQATETSSAAGPGQGAISVLITDPPRVPSGVTAVYAYYSGVWVHGRGGWVSLNTSGVVELMGTVNFGMTLSSKDLPVGTYDFIRFNITSATVTFQGKNYSALVQSGFLALGIRGGVAVSNSQAAAAIIDIQPVAINAGSSTSPQFILRPYAVAFSIPSSQVSPQMLRLGYRLDLRGLQWWDDDQLAASANLQVSNAALSSSSLNLTLKNAGSDEVHVRLVVISGASPSPIASLQNSVPTGMLDSAVFVVFPNGTMVQFTPLLHLPLFMQGANQSSSFIGYLLRGGYNLTADSSVGLSYRGQVFLGFGDISGRTVVSGSSYWVTVIGDETVSSVEVTAS